MPPSAPTPAYKIGIVKQVLSGDTVVIRKQPQGGPPPEKLITLSGIIAPKLARQKTANKLAKDSFMNGIPLNYTPYYTDLLHLIKKEAKQCGMYISMSDQLVKAFGIKPYNQTCYVLLGLKDAKLVGQSWSLLFDFGQGIYH